ncbi:MAG: FecR family protein [Myxococcota bacterium]
MTRQSRRYTHLFIALILAETWSPIAHASAAVLISSQGNVWITPQGSQERVPQVGENIEAGTRIRTGKDGAADLRFTNGSLLRLRPATSMRLSATPRIKEKKTSILLFFGRLWSKVARSESIHYEVNTPNAVAGVRGTEFETAVADDGSLRVRVQESSVAVGSDNKEAVAEAGTHVDGDERGLKTPQTAAENPQWNSWEASGQQRLRKTSRTIVDGMRDRIMQRKQKLEKLRGEQRDIERKVSEAHRRAQTGDTAAITEIRQYNQKLAEIADAIADIADQTESQFEIVDHFADLAGDPRLGISRKYIVSQAKSLRRVRSDLDKLVKEGTDISVDAMEKMLQDINQGKTKTLKDRKGSSADDLFGDDDMDFR